MATKEAVAHLNRPSGYEIAKLLIHHNRAPHAIKKELPYEICDQELYRILDPKNEECDVDVFHKALSFGGTKWTLNDDLFSEEEIESIKDKANSRILDKTSLTEEDLDKPPCSTHHDLANMSSFFS